MVPGNQGPRPSTPRTPQIIVVIHISHRGSIYGSNFGSVNQVGRILAELFSGDMWGPARVPPRFTRLIWSDANKNTPDSAQTPALSLHLSFPNNGPVRWPLYISMT